MTKNEAYNWFLLAKNARDRGEISVGLSAIEEAIKRSPKAGLNWILKGQLLEMGGEKEKTKEAYLLATELSPQSLQAWASLGVWYYESDQFNEGIKCLKKCLSLKGKSTEIDVDTLTLLAEMELKFDPKEALEHANMALELDPDWQEAKNARKAAMKLL